MAELGLHDRERACLLTIYAADQDASKRNTSPDERWMDFNNVSEAVDTTALTALKARGWIVGNVDQVPMRVHLTVLGRNFARQLFRTTN